MPSLLPLQLLLILTTAALNIEVFIEQLQEENRLLKIKLSLLEKRAIYFTIYIYATLQLSPFLKG